MVTEGVTMLGISGKKFSTTKFITIRENTLEDSKVRTKLVAMHLKVARTREEKGTNASVSTRNIIIRNVRGIWSIATIVRKRVTEPMHILIRWVT